LVALFNRVATNPVLRRVSDHAPYFATLMHRGAERGIVSPRFIPEDEATTALPTFVRRSLPLLGVHDFVRVDTEPAER
jgi:hypothetical protein